MEQTPYIPRWDRFRLGILFPLLLIIGIIVTGIGLKFFPWDSYTEAQVKARFEADRLKAQERLDHIEEEDDPLLNEYSVDEIPEDDYFALDYVRVHDTYAELQTESTTLTTYGKRTTVTDHSTSTSYLRVLEYVDKSGEIVTVSLKTFPRDSLPSVNGGRMYVYKSGVSSDVQQDYERMFAEAAEGCSNPKNVVLRMRYASREEYLNVRRGSAENTLASMDLERSLAYAREDVASSCKTLAWGIGFLVLAFWRLYRNYVQYRKRMKKYTGAKR